MPGPVIPYVAVKGVSAAAEAAGAISERRATTKQGEQVTDQVAAAGDPTGHHNVQKWRIAARVGTIVGLVGATVVGCSYTVDRGFDAAERAPGIMADAAGEAPRNLFTGIGEGLGNAVRGFSGGVVDSINSFLGVAGGAAHGGTSTEVRDEYRIFDLSFPETLEPVTAQVGGAVPIESDDTFTVNLPFADPITKAVPNTHSELDAKVTAEVLLRLPHADDNITVEANSKEAHATVEISELQASVADPRFEVISDKSQRLSDVSYGDGMAIANYAVSRMTGCARNLVPFLGAGLDGNVRNKLISKYPDYRDKKLTLTYTINGEPIDPSSITFSTPPEVTKEQLAQELDVNPNYLDVTPSDVDCDMSTAVVNKVVAITTGGTELGQVEVQSQEEQLSSTQPNNGVAE